MKLKFDCDLAQFERDLTKLGAKVATTITARALRAGGEILAEAQRDHAPLLDKKWPGSDSLEPGELKDDIGTFLNIDGEKGIAQIIVGPGYDTDYVANWLEKGHEEVAHGAYYINSKGIKKHHKHGVAIGDVPPHPFIGPAFEASAQAAWDKAAQVLTDGINEGLDGASGGDSVADGSDIETSSGGAE